MIKIISIINICFFININAQINCTIFINEKQENVKKCLHENGQISTLEIWDKEKRNGKSSIFNNKGTLLCEFSLRNYAGHSSVSLKYFPNGQVKVVDFSSAPDGGIQFYNEKIVYNELGDIISHDIQDYPDDLHLTIPNQIKKNNQKVEKCATPYTTYYNIKNSTNKNIEIKLFPQKNPWISLKEKILLVKKNKTITLDSIILAEKFLNENEGFVPSLNLSMKKYKKYSLLKLETIQSNNKKIYQWIIVKQ